MEVAMQSVNFKADSKLIDFTKRNLNVLGKFYGGILNIEVFLKVQKKSQKNNKLTEVRIVVPGREIVVVKEASTFEKGVKKVVHVLKRSLKKVNQKNIS